MFLFKKKKKTQFFGANIEPSCELCRYNSGKEKPFCVHGKDCSKVCKKYEYDPLKRQPDKAPKLKDYSADDFII
jgi:hypothetical protein